MPTRVSLGLHVDRVLEQWSFVSLAPTVLIRFTVYKVYWLLVTPLHWLCNTHEQVYKADVRRLM